MMLCRGCLDASQDERARARTAAEGAITRLGEVAALGRRGPAVSMTLLLLRSSAMSAQTVTDTAPSTGSGSHRRRTL